ncbi:MAG: zinc ribbon domain-containing protein [Chloroflexi bacterium]|nr:zinc ribbon domain-containing protein [Chloroflexota bacterium]
MPIYEYVCSDCGLNFDKLRPLSQATEPAACPHCQQNAQRKLSMFACFSASDSGVTSPVGGNACSSCGSSSCDSCAM